MDAGGGGGGGEEEGRVVAGNGLEAVPIGEGAKVVESCLDAVEDKSSLEGVVVVDVCSKVVPGEGEGVVLVVVVEEVSGDRVVGATVVVACSSSMCAKQRVPQKNEKKRGRAQKRVTIYTHFQAINRIQIRLPSIDYQTFPKPSKNTNMKCITIPSFETN